MSTLRDLQRQIGNLEAKLNELRDQLLPGRPTRPWWEQIVGSAQGRPLFAEVAREGKKLRRANRKKAGKVKPRSTDP